MSSCAREADCYRPTPATDCYRGDKSCTYQAYHEAEQVKVLIDMQVRKGRREIELARESIEDDRKRLACKEARLAELTADSQEKHHIISL